MNNSFFRPFMSSNVVSPIARNKFSITSIITNLEKTVSTINQVIPIYKEVKPLVSSSKNLLTNVTSYFKRSKNNSTSTTSEVIDAKVSEPLHETKKDEEAMTNINITTPSKAFFI